MKNKRWTESEKSYLRKHYHNAPNKDLAETLGGSSDRIKSMAQRMGLSKSAKYLRDNDAGRFKVGQKPWNKGVSIQPNNHAYRFKKGQKAHNARPIGYIREIEGWYRIKVSERKWIPLSVYVWISAGNEPPTGKEVIAFKDGYKPLSKDCFKIDRLHKLSMAEHLANNSINRYPKTLISAIHALSKLKKEISKHDDSNKIT